MTVYTRDRFLSTPDELKPLNKIILPPAPISQTIADGQEFLPTKDIRLWHFHLCRIIGLHVSRRKEQTNAGCK
jgi:hypothetical protein